AVTPTVAGTQLTLSGDNAGDTITLGTNAAGLLTHNLPIAGGLADSTDFNTDPAVATTLPANGTITVLVEAGAGNDNVNLSAATVGPSTINGGDGDDTLVGSPAADAVSGGPGNDRITGFRGNETTLLGGDGSDVLIWNNGDGTDVNEG